jgi:hypothetical protein
LGRRQDVLNITDMEPILNIHRHDILNSHMNYIGPIVTIQQQCQMTKFKCQIKSKVQMLRISPAAGRDFEF